MKKTLINTRGLQKANQHILAFIDKYEKRVLPLPFLSNQLNSETFFTPLSESSFFSQHDCKHPILKDLTFLGQALTLLLNEKGVIPSRIISLQALYNLQRQKLKEYEKLQKHFVELPVGDILHYSLIEPVLIVHNISPETVFGNPVYKKLCKEDPIVGKYNHICHFKWCIENYKEILKN
jgi:hypothetical protein